MAGTLFGLPLSQQVDATGTPISGGLLYIYSANTSTPSLTYSDFSLATLQTFPIELDSAGRIPSFYVDDGSYRARLTTSAGIEVFDEQSITAIGASAGSSGSSSSIDDAVIHQTGDFIWNAITGTRSGWVRANGRTIGSGSSSATERANADTQALFEYLYNALGDTIATVSGGRGASATADYNANKTITLLDLRGRALFGLDDMGTSTAGRIVLNTPTAVATTGGAEGRTVTQAHLPSYNLSLASMTVSVVNGTGIAKAAGTTSDMDNSGSAQRLSGSLAGNATITATIGGTLPSGGSGTSLPTMNPYMLGTYYIKL